MASASALAAKSTVSDDNSNNYYYSIVIVIVIVIVTQQQQHSIVDNTNASNTGATIRYAEHRRFFAVDDNNNNNNNNKKPRTRHRNPAETESISPTTTFTFGTNTNTNTNTNHPRRTPALRDDHDRRWNEMYQRLSHYKDRVGHANVPQHYNNSDSNDSDSNDGATTTTTTTTTAHLGKWLDKQRQLQTNGTLDPTRYRLLQDLGVAWDVRFWKWDTMFELLVRYHQKHGHANVPQQHREKDSAAADTVDDANNTDADSHADSDANLGAWLKDLRTRKMQGTLDPAREAKLEAIGVAWDMHSFRWNHMYQLLLQYQRRRQPKNNQRNPNTTTTHKQQQQPIVIKQNHKESGKNLGGWCSRQREAYKKGTLDLQRIQKLEEIGFTWTVPRRTTTSRKKKTT
eukprot:CAMPEP_0168179142 /NCGR_PEP_ID=MMETSP0139_2-20121125/9647_1 /TAXON_ID=44445 /ORGANISM="Pseudo-nitzschia australis, Strain 10249 10 AB" /LENGTH=399 /DNA_ID=CAMNT_0008098875 /DNA_START=33 /DNA_END=1234 /DNA_ORIENTATION=+